VQVMKRVFGVSILGGGYFTYKKWRYTKDKEFLMSDLKDDSSLIQKLGLNPDDDPLTNARRFLDYRARVTHENAYLTFNQFVHPDKASRESGKELTDKIDKEFNDLGSSVAVYKIVSGGDPEKVSKELSGDDQLMYKDLITGMQRNGCHLDEKINARCKEISDEMIELSSDFNTNVTESLPTVELDGDELAGLTEFSEKYGVEIPEDNVLKFKGYGLYTKVMKFCPLESVRRKTYINFSSVAKENIKILDRLQELRDERAKLLGFDNHAAFILDINSVKTPENALEFLGNFRAEVMKHADEENNAVCNVLGIDKTDLHKVYNAPYFMERYRVEKFNVDANEYKKYFELKSVLNTMMRVYEGFFEVKYEEVTQPIAEVWHDDVRTFRVNDARSNEFIGIIHLDLMGREGKWQHPSNFPLIRRHEYLEVEGSSTSDEADLPSAALVTSFETNEDEPVLLLRNEVETLFHEFGHTMHEVLNQKKYCSIGGTAVARDLVEVPSMYLEYLIWDPGFLKKVGRHYKTDKPMTKTEIDALVSIKHVGSVSYFLKQIAYSLFDLQFHSGRAKTGDFSAMINKNSMITGPPTAQIARFIHLVGYDAQYYTYMYDQSYAAMLNAHVGLPSSKKVNKSAYLEFLRNSTDHGLEDLLGPNDACILVEEVFGKQ
jgi:Zn-dependent oligopeptidase